MFKTLAATMLAASALLSVTTASSAFAGGCRDTVVVEQTGDWNDVAADSHGCNYTGIYVDGDFGEVTTETDGDGNAQVIGQEGFGNSVETELTGDDNGLGVRQAANGARAKVKMDGTRNKAAVYQLRSGAVASFNVQGDGNTVVSHQD